MLPACSMGAQKVYSCGAVCFACLNFLATLISAQTRGIGRAEPIHMARVTGNRRFGGGFWYGDCSRRK